MRVTNYSDVSGTVPVSALKVFWKSLSPRQTRMSPGGYFKLGTLEPHADSRVWDPERGGRFLGELEADHIGPAGPWKGAGGGYLLTESSFIMVRVKSGSNLYGIRKKLTKAGGLGQGWRPGCLKLAGTRQARSPKLPKRVGTLGQGHQGTTVGYKQGLDTVKQGRIVS